MKYEFGGKIMREFGAHRPKVYPYLMVDGNIYKKAKEQKNV